MSDLGNLSECMMENDKGAIEHARRLRRKALCVSLVIEALLVGVLMVWPYFTPGVLPAMALVTPVPPYRGAGQAPRVVERHPASYPLLTITDSAPRSTQRPLETFAGSDQPSGPGIIGIVESPGPGIPGATNSRPVNIPRPETPPAAKGPVKVSGGVMAARLVHRVEPEYPIAARNLHISGVVQLRAVIGTDGLVKQIEVVSGNAILALAAREAAAQWRYEPTRLGGEPVEVETDITVTFVMQ